MPGRDFLQIPGPTNIPERVLRAMDRSLINHMGEDMPPLTREVLAGLKRLFGTESGEVIIAAGSGSGAMESSLVNTVDRGERVLAMCNGIFGEWYARQASRLGAEVETVQAPWGDGAPVELLRERLAADPEHRIKVVTVVHNETSTGVTSDVSAVREALDEAGHPALLVVDVISSLGGIDFRFDAWGVDVAVCGAQKGLMLPPGLAIVCAGPRAIAACERVTTPRSYYDWRPALERLPSGYFPQTPPTSLLVGLREALRMLEEEGLDNTYRRHARLAEGTRRAVEAWDLATVCTDPRLASNTITAVRLPEEVDAGRVIDFAHTRLRLELGGGIGQLQGLAVRIGHLGWLNELEVLATLGGTELALAASGLGISLGSGVSAAQRFFGEAWPDGLPPPS